MIRVADDGRPYPFKILQALILHECVCWFRTDVMKSSRIKSLNCREVTLLSPCQKKDGPLADSFVTGCVLAKICWLQLNTARSARTQPKSRQCAGCYWPAVRLNWKQHCNGKFGPCCYLTSVKVKIGTPLTLIRTCSERIVTEDVDVCDA